MDRALTIIDVGHGNSAVLTCGDTVVVVDAGPRAGLIEYLLQQGIESIDTVLISHADDDHLGGLQALVSSRRFKIGHVRVNTDSSKDSAAWDDVVYALSDKNNAGEVDFEPALTVNYKGILGGGAVSVDVLAPSTYLAAKGPGGCDRSGRRLRSNSISAVIRISAGNRPIALLPGDLDEIGLQDLFDGGTNVTASILVFPHHGGRAGSGDEAERFSRALCERVRPSVVVFSVGRKTGRNPRPEVMRAIRGALPDVRVFCTQLSKHCAASTPKHDPLHLNPVFCRGRERRECCAGSIIVDLRNPDRILPLYADVQGFISREAANALCQQGT